MAFCYFAEEVVVVLVVSAVLAFMLDPLVNGFMWLRAPRALAAALSVLILLGAVAGACYVGFGQGQKLVSELPRYSADIHQRALKLIHKAQKLQALAPASQKLPGDGWTSWWEILGKGFGPATEVISAASFIPFLVFFMLTWQQHARHATVGLFPEENRRAAYVTIGLISGMVRKFIVGNLLVGLIIGGASTAVFGWLHLPFFYFAGFLSGFFSLVPYLGVMFALIPPLFFGIGHLNATSMMAISVTVFALHVVSINLLYPKVLGGRLRLNPLAVTIGLLLWAWLWGTVGLVLAVPITAAIKIICDHVDSLRPFGAWLGEESNGWSKAG